MTLEQPHIHEDSRAVLDAIRRIVQVLRKNATVAEKRVGLSAAQLFVLRKLAEAEMLTVGELAQRTATSQSSVSEVVQRLVNAGFVTRQRSPKDARSVQVSLTESGRALVAQAPEAIQDRVIEALDRLPISDRKQLAGLLTELLREIGVHGADTRMFFEPEHETEPHPQSA